MTREHKLALIVGFSLVLVLGVLISDHFSKARSSPLAVEIKEPSRPAFNASLAAATNPTDTLPRHPSAAPAPSGGLEPLPGRSVERIADAALPPTLDISMGPTGLPAGRSPFPNTTLAHLSEQPISQATPDLPVTSGTLKRYDVKENDNIYSIARRHYNDGNLWTKLRDYNKGKVTETGGMREGITLEIPPRDVLEGKARLPDRRTDSPALATAADPVKPEATKASGPGYIVQEGDTLYSIARKKLGSGKRAGEILEANRAMLDSPDELKIGMALRLPAR